MKHVIIVAVLMAGFVWLARPAISSTPYSYDEADYMYAASRGFVANYLDSPAQSFADFLRTGLSRGKDVRQKTALSQLIRDSGDIDFYRHWHGPLYFYWLVLLQPWKSSEHTVRALSLLFPALAILTIYLGSYRVFDDRKALCGGFFAAALYGWSVVTTVSTELAPHELFVLITAAGLFCLILFVETERRSYWHAAVVLSAMSVATLEVGLILVLVLAGVCFRHRTRLRVDGKFAGNSLLLLAASVFAVWPGAFLKLAFLKAYLFMAFLALVRKAAWGATFSQAWAARGVLAPVEWFLFALALLLFVLDRKARDRRAVPFLAFGLLMLLFLIRVNSDGARYMLPFLPAFDVFSAAALSLWLARFGSKAQTAFIISACFLLVFNTVRTERVRTRNRPYGRPSELLSSIRLRHLDDKTLLIPHSDFPMLHYYFPGARLIAYGEDSEGISPGIAADAIISEGDPLRITTY